MKELASKASLILVVGSQNSSNTNRLRETAEKNGATAYMVDDASQIKPEWLTGHETIGITAGASAPEILVQEIIAFLKPYGYTDITELKGVTETVSFGLPPELRSPGN